ncbi:TetR/AcrR family transcriptional regulator [Streptomyces sp. NPDC091377]|uniref:TetR/AcrR family transcriptional regulator n=1 Tax=unclassified Streptomyces TaxID=2593676 RepID=UPI0037F28849
MSTMPGSAAAPAAPPAPQESGTRNRTRRAILDAAASVLGRDRRATLAEIAKAADVGRSTLHRYFPDRDQLLRAAVLDSLELIDRAVGDAATEQGTPLEGVHRLITAVVGLGDRMLFAYGEQQILDELNEQGGADDPVERLILDLIERGQREGVLDSGVSATWIMQVMWALVYAGAEAARNGTVPRPGVTAQVIRTFEGGVLAREAGDVTRGAAG